MKNLMINKSDLDQHTFVEVVSGSIVGGYLSEHTGTKGCSDN